MPVLFFFHGAGGNGSHCGSVKAPDSGLSWSDYAVQNGFAFICGEATQYPMGEDRTGGLWNIPTEITDETGNRCSESDQDAPEI
jgi:hypothetical protein